MRVSPRRSLHLTQNGKRDQAAINARWPVSRVLYPRAGDDHSSRRTVAGTLVQPTRAARRKRCMCRPYSVLLPVGFTVPSLLPGPRCALTAPFHPYLPRTAGGLLSVALSLGSPPPGVT